MKFQKLALAAAVAAAPTAGLAMEPMNDSALSDVTGQDGIVISLSNNIATDIVIHDTDGFGGTTADAGAILLNNVAVTLPANQSIQLDIDADQNAGAPSLQIGVTLPNNISMALGDLGVADSNRPASWGYDTTTDVTGIINMGTVTLGTTTLNIQLGNEPQGDMIAMATTVTGGVSLANFAINDANSGGSIGMSQLDINNAGGDTTTDLNIDAGINATTNGLVVSINQFGTTAGGADIRITDLVLGDTATAPVVGDVEILGLDITGDITISGK